MQKQTIVSFKGVQILDSLTFVAVLVGVFLIKPQKRCIAYNVTVLVVLLLRVCIPFAIPNIKFRFYLALRFFCTGLGIGLSTVLFVIFSQTHPMLYVLVLGATTAQEIVTIGVYLRKPTEAEYLD